MSKFPLVLVVLALLAVLVAIGALAVAWDNHSARQRRQRERERVVQQARATDAAVARDHAAARRAMNNAAGQGWRNTFE